MLIYLSADITTTFFCEKLFGKIVCTFNFRAFTFFLASSKCSLGGGGHESLTPLDREMESLALLLDMHLNRQRLLSPLCPKPSLLCCSRRRLHRQTGQLKSRCESRSTNILTRLKNGALTYGTRRSNDHVCVVLQNQSICATSAKCLITITKCPCKTKCQLSEYLRTQRRSE